MEIKHGKYPKLNHPHWVKHRGKTYRHRKE